MGPLFVGLWTDSSLVIEGNISVGLYLREGDTDTLVASASRSLDIDPSQVPEPTSLIPPDPTDPEAAAYYIAAQALPLINKPPMLLDLGMVDVEVPENATLVLGFSLVAPGGGALPAGFGVASIKYDSALTPSYLYAPWYAADPVMPSPSASPSASPSGSPTSGSPSGSTPPGTGDPSETKAEESPGAGILVVVGALGLALLRRRK
jgi:uncharacterized protein (TIGR03382 family)